MTAEAFEALIARQTPDAEKRARADFVIDTSGSVEDARRQVRRILAEVTAAGWRSKGDLEGPSERPH
jgi:dephospho-CoA kinase